MNPANHDAAPRDADTDVVLDYLVERSESVGDNCEFGFYLRSRGHESGSLFRWAICPIEQLIAYIARDGSRAAYRFDALTPFSPGMVIDNDTGFCFHTAMRSTAADDSYQFNATEEERRDIHAREYEKYCYLLERFESNLADDEPRVYVIKCNTGIEPDQVQRLDEQLRAHRSPESYIILEVIESDESAIDAPIRWQSDTHCRALIRQFAPYSEASAIDTDNWAAILQRLAGSDKVQHWVRREDQRRHLDALIDEWRVDSPQEQKREVLFQLIKQNDVELADLMDTLAGCDPSFYRAIGGELFHAVYRGHALHEIQHFDDLYLQLMSLYGNSDLEKALDFHQRAKALCDVHCRSLIRYERIGHSLERTRQLLQNLESQGARLHDILPKDNAAFPSATTSLQEAGKVLSHADSDVAVCTQVLLPETKERHRERLSLRDDHDRAASNWISGLRDDPIDRLRFYSLPSARISYQPTGISFREHDQYRFVNAMSDMYHYFRVAGKTAFSPLARHRQSAYFLPRYGISNHYHSLVDKLPALYGYHLLKLSCPIYSTYELSDTERYFASLMGIDPDAIQVDLNGEAMAETGILPNIAELRPLFFEFCSRLDIPRSTFSTQVYIARTKAPARVMENESAVVELVSDHGFDVICLEDHPLEEQIAIVGNADVIVGPHGAGLANMVFAKPGLGVIELIPEKYMTPLFAQLSIDCGHRYSVIMGDVDKASSDVNKDLRWNVPLDRLNDVLLSLEENRRNAA